MASTKGHPRPKSVAVETAVKDLLDAALFQGKLANPVHVTLCSKQREMCNKTTLSLISSYGIIITSVSR